MIRILSHAKWSSSSELARMKQCRDSAGGVIPRRCPRRRSGAGRDDALLGADDAIPHRLLTFAKVVADFLLIVAEVRGDLAADFAEPFEVVGIAWGGGRVHGSTPSSSSGVTSFGVS